MVLSSAPAPSKLGSGLADILAKLARIAKRVRPGVRIAATLTLTRTRGRGIK
jgi:hypothetical protein